MKALLASGLAVLCIAGCANASSVADPIRDTGTPEVSGDSGDVLPDAPPDVDAEVADPCDRPATCPCSATSDCKRFDEPGGCAGHHACVGSRCAFDPSTVVTCDTTKDPPCRRNTCVAGECVSTALTDGAACDDGNPCTVDDACASGACGGKTTGGCAIDGACWAPLALDPVTRCRRCDPTESPTKWSNVALGTSCDGGACLLAAQCDGKGSCTGKPAVPGTPTATGPTRPTRSGSIPVATRRPKLTWAPPGDADVCGKTTYELELDDSCGGAYASCTFPSPEISVKALTAAEWQSSTDLPLATSPPFGRRHAFRVRACNTAGCSPFSSPWFLDIGRALRDVNGDGYSDLVVGAPGDERGKLFVYAGGASGLGSTPTWVLVDPELGSALLGETIVVGDFDGDGFADIVATETKSGSSTRLIRFPGGASGPTSAVFQRLDVPTTGAWSKAPLTNSVATPADLDGDGIDDLVVAATAVPEAGETPPIGYVFAGRVGGPLSTPSSALPGRPALSWGDYDDIHPLSMEGDFDGDGNPDLAFAVYRKTLSYFEVWRGQRGGSPVFLVRDTNGFQMDPYQGRRFPVAFADLTGDGLDDLIFPGRDAGSIDDLHVMVLAAGAKLGPSPILDFLPPPNSTLGASLVATDLDGDSLIDLAIGAPGGRAAGKPGRVYLRRGLVKTTTVPSILSCDDDSAGFGEIVVNAGDLDGNGLPDLAVGVWNYGTSGRVFVYHSAKSALPTTPAVTLSHPTLLFNARFGANLGR